MPPLASTDILVSHPMPLLAAGLTTALAPDARVLPHTSPATLLERSCSGLLVTDLGSALALMEQDRPRPGHPWQPWRCVVVSIDLPSCQVRHALQQGVLGFVQAGCKLEELQLAVAAAGRGQRYLCSATAARLAEAAVDEALTPRENEVLHCLCQGLDNKSIALRLDMALGTVKTHVKAILDKLGASSRTQAVATAHKRGLASPGAAPMPRAPAAARLGHGPIRRPVPGPAPALPAAALAVRAAAPQAGAEVPGRRSLEPVS